MTLVHGGALGSFDRLPDREPARRATTSEPRVRWTALSYHLPTRPSRLRVAIWRQLNRVSALNLHHALWAVKHDEHGDRSARELLATVANLGGQATWLDVAPDTDGYAELEAELAVACDHLWDPFFNHVDRLGYALQTGDDAAAFQAEIDDLRGRYGEMIRRDVSRRDGALRASRRLVECETLFRDRFGDAEIEPDPPPRGRRRLAAQVTSWQLDDGSIDYLAAVQPLPSIGWEQAFVDFEAAIYLPSPTRVPLRHGTFSFRCAPDERDHITHLCQQRVERFELSLA